MKEPLVILVNEDDVQTGTAPKLHAHRNALLHRAVSVFIMNSKGEWLLQRRSRDKYHSKGLWTNACCTHPLPGESTHESAKRRLKEEMGIECVPDFLFSFIYRERMDKDLTEHELDHVFFGMCDEEPLINKTEVEEYAYMTFEGLHKDISVNPSDYTYWFRKIYKHVNDHIKNNKV